MIFLLFLVSVAVMEYVVRRPEETEGGTRPGPARDRMTESGKADATPGLAALGRALEQYGRGLTPGGAQEGAEIHGPTTDRV